MGSPSVKQLRQRFSRECRVKIEGFTIVELLLTITIIGILAALTIAGVNAVRDRGNEAASAEILRQWGAALPGYEADNGGQLPRRGQGVQPLLQINRPQDWFNALPPYMNLPTFEQLVAEGTAPTPTSNSIFICPGVRPTPAQLTAAHYMGYGMNMNLCPWNIPNPTYITDIAHPALVVFMGESPGPYSSVYPSGGAYSVIAPHGGRGNLLFLDGHVASFTAAYIGCGKGDPDRPDISWKTGTEVPGSTPTY